MSINAKPAPTHPLQEVTSFQILDVDKFDQLPVLRSRVAPVYPLSMQRSWQSGQVLVDFIIDTNGGVIDASVKRSTNRLFAAAALEAVKKWKFSPGMKQGRAMNTHVQVPIAFSFHRE